MPSVTSSAGRFSNGVLWIASESREKKEAFPRFPSPPRVIGACLARLRAPTENSAEISDLQVVQD